MNDLLLNFSAHFANCKLINSANATLINKLTHFTARRFFSFQLDQP